MTEEQAKKDSADLIVEVCKKVGGVGPGKGYAVAEFFDSNWKGFLKADENSLLKIVRGNGTLILSKEQIEKLVKEKSEFSSFLDVRTAWIFLIGKDFLVSQIEMLRSTSLSNLDINPFLMKVLNLKTPGEILEFNLYQSVTRSIVTSWGTAVENLLNRCGATKFAEKNEGRAGRRPDILKEVKGKTYFIQVKSGPNTMNVDMVNSLNEVIISYREKRPDTKFLLGMTYGTEKRISTQIRDNLIDFENSTLIGRQLWDFVSEEKSFHKKIFNILDSSSVSITTKTFSEHLIAQLEVLAKEWKERYGNKSVDEAFENYI